MCPPHPYRRPLHAPAFAAQASDDLPSDDLPSDFPPFSWLALQFTSLAKRLKAPEPIKSGLPNPALTTGAFFVCPISDSHFVGTALFSAHVASRPVSLPKIDAPHPDQRRRHAAHRLGCPHLYAGAISGIGNTSRNGNGRASCYSRKPMWKPFSRQGELALFYDAKLVLT
jgi:hypothetical protein